MKHLTFLLALAGSLAGAELGNKIPDTQPEASVNLMSAAWDHCRRVARR